MRSSALAVLCALALSVISTGASAAGGDPFPTGAHIEASVAIPGVSDVRAVLYAFHGQRLGVLSKAAGGDTLTWSLSLESGKAALIVPSHPHVFEVVIHGMGGKDQIGAFAIKNGVVSSAIAGTSSGMLSGDEADPLAHGDFALAQPDRHHIGLVPYRIETRYAWRRGSFRIVKTSRSPDIPGTKYPVPNAVVHTRSGDIVLLRLEVAADEAARETGLMNRKTLDPDSGMIFVWDQPVRDGFWMKDTQIPLTVAFLSPDGTILQTLSMQPLTLIVHEPRMEYQYAIEVNQGYFHRNGIRVGDRVLLHLSTTGAD